MTFRIAYYRLGGEMFDVYTAEFTGAGKFQKPSEITPEGTGINSPTTEAGLRLNDQTIIDNGGSYKTTQKSAQVVLAKGYHKFDLRYHETGFDVKLQLHYSLNGSGMNETEHDLLFH